MAVPGSASWVPSAEREIQDAIDQGLLEESHFLELKEDVPGGQSGNKELARDVCSLSVDGGLLIVGIAERSEGLVAAPRPLNQLTERIEQVVRSLVCPRLAIGITAIPSAKDPSSGYIAIQVPASPLAPHMVDHKYIGRGDKTKHFLDDAEVERLHGIRKAGEGETDRVLNWLVGRDPVQSDERRHAHLFFVARPTRPIAELVIDLTRPASFWDEFREVLTSAAQEAKTGSGASLLQMTTSPARRLDGVALTNAGLTDHRRPAADARDPEDITEVELAETGEVRIFYGELSRQGRPPFSDEAIEIILDALVPELVRQGIAVASQIAQRFDYQGPWFLGVALTGIGGLTVSSSTSEGFRQPRRLEATADEYRGSTVASGNELQTHPGTLTAALVGRFLRAAGTEHSHLAGVLSNPQ